MDDDEEAGVDEISQVRRRERLARHHLQVALGLHLDDAPPGTRDRGRPLTVVPTIDLLHAVPELRLEVTHVSVTADTATLDGIIHGAHWGTFAAMAPTGRTMSSPARWTIHFENDRPVRATVAVDLDSIAAQLAPMGSPARATVAA